MKKALIAALCFIIVGFSMVNDTFAGDFGEAISNVFADLSELWSDALGKPEAGGKTVDVELISYESPSSLLPGGTASRSFHVKNTGTGSVYFRLVYAVQYDAETWHHLDIEFDAEDGFTGDDWQNIVISGTPYKMKVFTYNQALPANGDSPRVRISIAMDTAVTSEDMARYRNDFLKTQVLAIDPTPFTEKGYSTAVEALNAALPLDTLNPF